MQFQKRILMFDSAKKCALICVHELLDYCSGIDDHHGISYWGEVKKEINKL